MTTYAVYTLKNKKYVWNFISAYYPNCLNKINELTKAGKDCVLISDSKGKLPPSIDIDDVHNFNIEIMFLGDYSGN